MARRRTRYSLENAKVYPTGQDIEAATAAGLVVRGLNPAAAQRGASVFRCRFERACLPTIDPSDRAHDIIDPGSRFAELMPGEAVDHAKPRRYPAACLVEVVAVRRGRVVGRGVVSIDSECESLGEITARLAAAGIPVGYVGSVTGDQQQRCKGARDVPILATVAAMAADRGTSIRAITRQETRQKLTATERALTEQANEILRAAEKKAKRGRGREAMA